MSYLHLPLTQQVQMDEVFSDMPAKAKAYIRGGFSVLAKVPESARPALLQAAVQATGQRKGQRDRELATALGLSLEESTSAVAALGMLSALASSRTEPPDRLVKAMVEAEIIAAPDTSTISGLIPAITDVSSDVRKAIGTRALANSVLPSFDAFEAVVDVRVGHEETAGLAVPVAIAYLGTDARERRLWFQLTKEDVEDLVKQLNSLLEDFKQAEEMIGRLSSHGGA